MKTRLIIVLGSIYFVSCRDFYAGMFKKNYLLVAQDRLYKDKIPFRFAVAKYGRLFKCPITYIRVTDRLGVGRGPTVKITRGGLQKKYVTLNIVSPYNLPISVNIYVGCANNIKPTTKSTASTTTSLPVLAATSNKDDKTTVSSKGAEDNKTTKSETGDKVTDGKPGEETTNATGGGETTSNDGTGPAETNTPENPTTV